MVKKYGELMEIISKDCFPGSKFVPSTRSGGSPGRPGEEADF